MKFTIIAITFMLTLFPVHPVHAANLAALLQADYAEGNGVDYNPTNVQWFTNSSMVSMVSDSVVFNHLQEMTSASFGNLSIAFNLDEYGVNPAPDPSSGYGGYAGLQASWSDNVTISNATLNGTQGYLRPVILYSCSVSASCASDATNSASVVYFNITPSVGFDLTNFDQVLWAYPTDSPQTVNLSFNTAGLAAFAGVSNLDIPFVYGQPFGVSFGLTLSDGSPNSAQYYYIVNHRGALKLQWLGAQVLDANSNVVSNFALTSDSGTDWAVSQAGVATVLQIGGVTVLNKTNLVVNGANGTPFKQVILLGSANPHLAMTNWSPLNTNSFDLSGNVSFTNVLTVPQYYFRLISN